MFQREKGAEALREGCRLSGQASAKSEDRRVLSFEDALGNLGGRCCCHFCDFVGYDGEQSSRWLWWCLGGGEKIMADKLGVAWAWYSYRRSHENGKDASKKTFRVL